MANQWICSQCQHANAADMHFCLICGAANPALAMPIVGFDGTEPTPTQRKRHLLWTVTIALWVIGCAAIVVGGGIWWARQQSATVITLITPATASNATAPSPSPLPATVTPTPTRTSTPTPLPEPSVAATLTPAKQETSQSTGGDKLTPDNTDDSLTSTGDTLALPTRASEGVILFLSSRDHDPQTEAERQKLGQNRELELYAMRSDGSDQIRLSVGNQGWGNMEAAITPYVKPNQVVINGRYVFDLTTRQVVDELQLEFTVPGASRPQRASLPVWSPRGEIVFCCVNVPGAIYYLADVRAELQQLTTPPAGGLGSRVESWGSGER